MKEITEGKVKLRPEHWKQPGAVICDGCDTHHIDYCQERCYGRSWHGYLLAHTQLFLFPSSSSFLSFSIAQIRGQSLVSLRSSVPYHRDRDILSQEDAGDVAMR